ncbi:unnamed protein product [Calicophoron daubneyi]|uniref:Uncharacterized protein n=1 Tax=Calicophoron daubneyi TaxID=300641 RepID=A0AAV2TLI7_CALDB
MGQAQTSLVLCAHPAIPTHFPHVYARRRWLPIPLQKKLEVARKHQGVQSPQPISSYLNATDLRARLAKIILPLTAAFKDVRLSPTTFLANSEGGIFRPAAVKHSTAGKAAAPEQPVTSLSGLCQVSLSTNQAISTASELLCGPVSNAMKGLANL